ncbi:MAG: chitin deacetylase family protein [Thermomicrobiales bacterium]
MPKGVAFAIGFCVLALTGLLIRPGPVVRWLARRHPDILFHMETEELLVALTIDDSPHPSLTPRILDVLAEHDAHATFFVIGERVAGNEEIVRRMAAAGHQLGNHLMADAPSARLSAAEFERQLLHTHEVLAPYGPIRWFRPGHGWFNRRMIDQIHLHGYRCAMASAYAFEFHIPSARYAALHILFNVRPGAVIVLHDGGQDRERTVAVLRRVLPELKRRGYRVVTLSELVRENDEGAHSGRAPLIPAPFSGLRTKSG